MAEETVAVIDSGQDMGRSVTTTLQGESYPVYHVSSQDVNAEMAERLRTGSSASSPST